MIRYLEVGVTRKQYSTVFIAVDDDDPAVKAALEPSTEGLSEPMAGFHRGRLLFALAQKHAKAAAEETIGRLDWEDGYSCGEDDDVEVDSAKEVEEAHAREYTLYTVEPANPGAVAS